MKEMEKVDEKTLRDELKKSADSYKEQLEIDVNESLDQIQRLVKIAAMAAGGAFVGYSIYKGFFESKKETGENEGKKKKRKNNSYGKSGIFQPILKAGIEVAAAFLLSIAKQKLQEYIRDLEKTKSSLNGNSAGDY